MSAYEPLRKKPKASNVPRRAIATSQRPPIQTALEVSQPGDELEREADRVADHVLRGAAAPSARTAPAARLDREATRGDEDEQDNNSQIVKAMLQRMCARWEAEEDGPPPDELQREALVVQRECAACSEEEEQEQVQREAATPGPTAAASAPAFQAALSSARAGGGEPLAPEVKGFMEPRFGQDFGGVRVHRDAAASQLTEQVQAKAFTVGRDVFFREGQYEPSSEQGKRLIAHELTHVVQQREGVRSVQREILQRFPDVVPEAIEEDKKRTFVDPSDGETKPVYDAKKGYIKNPTAKPLDTLITGQGAKAKVGGDFSNGVYMYVVDKDGKMWIGKRAGTNMPHPTLIGGTNPHVQAAGMIRIEAGKIVEINNHSGHYRPPRSALNASLQSALKLPAEVFHQKFVAQSFEGETQGKPQFKGFRNLQMLKLSGKNLKVNLGKIGKRFKWNAVKGTFKSRGFRGSARGVGGAIALLASQWLLAKLEQERLQKEIQADIEKLQPKIESALEAKSAELDRLLQEDASGDVFINIRLKVKMFVTEDPEHGPQESFFGVELVEVGYSRTPWNAQESFDREQVGCISHVDATTHTVSEKVPVADFFAPEP
jgi:hypothetical protein